MTVLGMAWGLGDRSASPTWRVRLTAILPLSLAALVFVGGMIYGLVRGAEYQAVQRALENTRNWDAAQVRADRLRLVAALEAYRMDDPVAGADAVRQRFQDIWAQMPLLMSADAPRGTVPEGRPLALSLALRMAAAEQDLTLLEQGDVGAADRIRAALAGDDDALDRLAEAARISLRSGEKRLEALRARVALGMVLGGAGGFLMIGLIAREIGLRRRLVLEAERERQRARSADLRLNAAIEAFAEGFALFDADDRLVLCNARYRAMYGAIADIVRPGVTFTEIYDAFLDRGLIDLSGVSREVARASRLAAHAGDSSTYLQHLADGRWIEIREWRMPDGGSVGVRIDVTAAMARLQEAEEARRAADRASRSKSEFLANMSHELRTPLNAILGFSEIIAGQMFGPIGTPAYVEYAGDIHRSGTHLLTLINDILDLSKVESGHMELREGPVDLGRLASSCVSLVRERALAHGVRVVEDITHMPALRGDETRLKQALLNLLTNAVKFTPPGGLVFLSVRHEHASGRCVMEVRDTGEGMDSEDIPRALSPFIQIESRNGQHHEGTGLGLPITKMLMEMHGGSLEIESVRGQGTTARLILPEDRIVS